MIWCVQYNMLRHYIKLTNLRILYNKNNASLVSCDMESISVAGFIRWTYRMIKCSMAQVPVKKAQSKLYPCTSKCHEHCQIFHCQIVNLIKTVISLVKHSWCTVWLMLYGNFLEILVSLLYATVCSAYCKLSAISEHLCSTGQSTLSKQSSIWFVPLKDDAAIFSWSIFWSLRRNSRDWKSW